MSGLVILPWLYATALLGQSDLGVPAVVVCALGLVGLLVTLVAATRRPSWRLLLLLLPLVVVHAYAQIVGVWGFGNRDEVVAVAAYVVLLLATLVIAAWVARANPLAVAGLVVFALAYGWIAYEASLFVFWTDLH